MFKFSRFYSLALLFFLTISYSIQAHEHQPIFTTEKLPKYSELLEKYRELLKELNTKDTVILNLEEIVRLQDQNVINLKGIIRLKDVLIERLKAQLQLPDLLTLMKCDLQSTENETLLIKLINDYESALQQWEKQLELAFNDAKDGHIKGLEAFIQNFENIRNTLREKTDKIELD